MNRVNPALFSAVFTAWVREAWPERPDLIAIDGKTSRRSHDRGEDRAPLHLVSAFATTSRLVLGQEAVDWLNGARRFPGETRLPDAATLIRVTSRAELSDRSRFETRCFVSSARLEAARAAEAVRSHWIIENALNWTLDVVFAEDQSRLRNGHGARNMAVVRHFAINLIRHAPEPERPAPMKPQRKADKPRKISLKLRRKIASWRSSYLETALAEPQN